MKKFSFILFIYIFTFLNIYSQEAQDSVAIEKKFFSIQYTLDNNKLSLRQMKDIMKDCPEAYSKIRNAAHWETGFRTINVLGFSTIFIGSTIAQGFDSRPVLVGGALLLLGIPMGITMRVQAKKAVMIYNSDKINTSSANLKFGFTASGVAISYNFMCHERLSKSPAQQTR